MQFTDFWIGKIQADKLPESLDTPGLIKYLSVFASEEQCFQLMYQWHESSLKRTSEKWFPKQELIKMLEDKVHKKGISPTLRLCLELLDSSEKRTLSSQEDRINIRIDNLVNNSPDLLISRRDPLGIYILNVIEGFNKETQQKEWIDLLRHCLNAGTGHRPTLSWLKKSRQLAARLDNRQLSQYLHYVIAYCRTILTERHEGIKGVADFDVEYLSPINHDLLKALIWFIPLIKGNALHDLVEDYARWAFKKSRESGPLSVKTGLAAAYTLTFLPFDSALARILAIRESTQDKAAQKSIDKILLLLAEKNNISATELEESLVPSFGLLPGGILDTTIGKYTVTCQLSLPGKSVYTWSLNGDALETVPSLQKEKPFKAFQAQVRNIEMQLATYNGKLEALFLQQRSWSFSHWEKYYLQHPLLGKLSSSLIWTVNNGNVKTECIPLDGQMVSLKGTAITMTPDTIITLWHPYGADSKTVHAWKQFLAQQKVEQPFEQAHRKIFTPTTEELAGGLFSLRYSSLSLNREKFINASIGKGWNVKKKVPQHWRFLPFLELTDWDMRVNFLADVKDDDIIFTDHINFYKQGAPLPIIEVPPVIFSEVMLHIDLFVRTASNTELHNR